MNFTLVALIIVVVVNIIIIYYINKRGNNRFSKLMGLLFIFLTFHIIVLILLNLLKDKDFPVVYIDNLTYFSTVSLPIIFFMMAIEYRSPGKKLNKMWWLFIVPIITLITVWTNDFHHLFYTNYSLNMIENRYGPMFVLHSIYTYGLLAISILIILHTSIRKSGFFSKQTLLMIIGACIPILVNLLGTLRIIPMSIYTTPITFVFSGICYFIAIVKLKVLNITPIAFRTIIDTMSDAYIVISDEGIIVDNNQTFYNIFKEILNGNKNDDFYQMLSENNLIDVKELKQNIAKTRECGEIVTVEYHIAIKDEKNSTDDEIKYIFNKYFEVDIHPIRASRGKEYVGTLLLFKDVTQHMEDMLELQAKQDVIVKQGQLVSIGELAGGVAHDINTPISAIKTGITMLNDLYEPRDEREKEIITRMDSCADKIIKIVNSMRNQIRNLGNKEKVRFKVSDVIKDIQVITFNEFQKNNCTLNITIQDDVEVMGEPTKLRTGVY